MIRNLMIGALLLGASAPLLAVAPVPATPAEASSAPGAIPALLDAKARDDYRAVFAAMRAADWTSAAARLDAIPDGLLTSFARAELFLAKGSPAADAEPLVALLSTAPDLPQAARLAALARKRGVDSLPALPIENELKRMSGAPRRQSARSIKSDAVAMALGAQITPLIKDDRPAEAEALLIATEPTLCAEAQTEWQQRVAWSYFLTGDDLSARRLADRARVGMGEWAVQADWVAGLAAWRQKDYEAATQAFANVAARARDTEMTAAGLFWAARADLAAGHPEKVQSRLRTASRLPETFYGLLAGGALGQALPQQQSGPQFIAADWSALSQRRNIRVATALTEIGEYALADTTLRHQARIGATRDHEALLHLAARLNLPSAQIWLAQNGPAGTSMSAGSRYPAPSWSPRSGWRVDKSLVFAHALQESQFRSDAISPAGARGLLQLLPGTAQLIDRHRGSSFGSNLNDPQTNIEYGQAYMEELRDGAGTGGLLPKVIAAYNAGPGSVVKWNDRRRDGGDPLLFIETIPFAETRGYVAVVLRNYWMYQRQAGVKSDSLRAIAQGMWPKFPGLPGRTAIRLDGIGGIAAAD